MNTDTDKASDTDDDFARHAKKLFDDSVQSLDGHTQSRLNQGRQRALAVNARARAVWSRWVPAAGITSAALVAIVMGSGPGDVQQRPGVWVATDMELLLQDDSLEMLEDLEFYRWVDLHADGTDDNAG